MERNQNDRILHSTEINRGGILDMRLETETILAEVNQQPHLEDDISNLHLLQTTHLLIHQPPPNNPTTQ